MKLPLLSLLFWAASACELDLSNYVHSSSLLPEASDVVRVGNYYFLVMDDYCWLGKVAVSGGEISRVFSPDGPSTCGDSDHEAIFRLPEDADDEFPTFIVCGEDTLECNQLQVSGSSYQVTQLTLVDGGDGCHDGINWDKNKGVEGAVGLLGEDGHTYMLALIEKQGTIITYRREGSNWVSQGCTDVPATMKDYSSLSYFSTASGTVVTVTSQKGGKLWVGSATGISAAGLLESATSFGLETGTVYDFPSAYEGVEGIFIETYDPSTGNMAGVLASDDQAGNGAYANAVHKFTLTCATATNQPTLRPTVLAPSGGTVQVGSTALVATDSYCAGALFLGEAVATIQECVSAVESHTSCSTQFVYGENGSCMCVPSSETCDTKSSTQGLSVHRISEQGSHTYTSDRSNSYCANGINLPQSARSVEQCARETLLEPACGDYFSFALTVETPCRCVPQGAACEYRSKAEFSVYELGRA